MVDRRPDRSLDDHDVSAASRIEHIRLETERKKDRAEQNSSVLHLE